VDREGDRGPQKPLDKREKPGSVNGQELRIDNQLKPGQPHFSRSGKNAGPHSPHQSTKEPPTILWIREFLKYTKT